MLYNCANKNNILSAQYRLDYTDSADTIVTFLEIVGLSRSRDRRYTMQSRVYIEPHRIDGDTLEVSACFESGRTPGRVQRLWWRLPAALRDAVTPWADPFAIAFLFPMMEDGSDVLIEGRVSPSLLENLETYMSIWQAWEPGLYKQVLIRATEEIEAPPPAVPGETIMPFSCGVDSSYTALRHHRQLVGRRNRRIGAAVVMNSFDGIVRPTRTPPACRHAGWSVPHTMLGRPLDPLRPDRATTCRELPAVWRPRLWRAPGQRPSPVRSTLRSRPFFPNDSHTPVPFQHQIPHRRPRPPYLWSRHFAVIDNGARVRGSTRSS